MVAVWFPVPFFTVSGHPGFSVPSAGPHRDGHGALRGGGPSGARHRGDPAERAEVQPSAGAQEGDEGPKQSSLICSPIGGERVLFLVKQLFEAFQRFACCLFVHVCSQVTPFFYFSDWVCLVRLVVQPRARPAFQLPNFFRPFAVHPSNLARFRLSPKDLKFAF